MKRLRLLLALLVMTIAVASPMAAQLVQGQAVAQSYASDTPLQAGMIVKLSGDKTKVVPVAQSDNDKMHGVVIRSNDAPLTLSEGESPQAVFVVTNGKYQILVTDQNGVIKKGDYLVVSAVEGVGMKANRSIKYIVGKALTGFDGKNSVLSQTTLKDAAGNNRTVNFGYVEADINVSRNPLAPAEDSNLPGFLRKASEAVSGKAVSPFRGYVALGVLIVTATIVVVILYAGVRTSLVSIGRNPLARKSIVRNLIQVVLIGLIILVAGLIAVYLLLKV
jgi:hypothetical protein